MSKKKLTINDATKEELIQYFFTTDYFGGGYRIQTNKERFLIWLENKRTDALLTENETLTEAIDKALQMYIEYVKQANAEKDLAEKLKLFDKANRAYKRYESLNKKWDAINKKLDEHYDIGGKR